MRKYQWFMRLLTVIYLLVGVAFFFYHDQLVDVLNLGSKIFTAFQPLPVSIENKELFWTVLATSMMVMLSLTALFSSIYPTAASFLIIHLASKLTSTVSFIYLLKTQTPYFAYLVGTITDSFIFLVVLYFYLRAVFTKSIATVEPQDNTLPPSNTDPTL